MRRWTIAERLLVAVLVPLALLLCAGALPWPKIGALADYGPIGVRIGALLLAVARSLSRPLTDAGETIDAILRAETDCAPDIWHGGRCEIERLLHGIDRLADLLREQHRRDIVLIDVERKQQSDRRVTLSTMAN